MKVMWETMKDLQTTDKEISKKVSAIELLVAGTYIRREDFEKTADTIFKKLDKIEEKLDRKADK